jgi:hypothetical protein
MVGMHRRRLFKMANLSFRGRGVLSLFGSENLILSSLEAATDLLETRGKGSALSSFTSI